MSLVKLLLISSLLSLLFGQLIRIPLASSNGSISVTDILVFITVIVFIFYQFYIRQSFKLPLRLFFPAAIFILLAASSTLLSKTVFSTTEVLISSLFLIRFIVYFFLALVTYNIVKKDEIKSWLDVFLLVAVIYALFGFVQLLIFPDLSSLAAYGWDPHQKRIVSTLLDPNYTGIIFTVSIAISASMYLYKKGNIYLLVTLISIAGLIFTFSRSSYLAFLASIMIIGALKSPKIIFTSLLIFTIAALSVPRVRSRVMGAFSVDETSQARIESWKNAATIFLKNPVFGVGFDTYRFAQRDYGFFQDQMSFEGHSGAGSDSSILLIAATTGIFGLAFFLLILLSIVKLFSKNASSDYLKLGSLASFLGLLVHSQFVNSLLFPQVMLFFWFLVGLNLTRDD